MHRSSWLGPAGVVVFGLAIGTGCSSDSSEAKQGAACKSQDLCVKISASDLPSCNVTQGSSTTASTVSTAGTDDKCDYTNGADPSQAAELDVAIQRVCIDPSGPITAKMGLDMNKQTATEDPENTVEDVSGIGEAAFWYHWNKSITLPNGTNTIFGGELQVQRANVLYIPSVDASRIAPPPGIAPTTATEAKACLLEAANLVLGLDSGG